MLIYKIAVCDDEELQLERIYNMVNDNFEKLECVFEISKFIYPKHFIEANYLNNFDVVFLDIDMPEMNGFDVAKHINTKSSNTIIVFVTSRDDLVFESFKVQPFRFIRKSNLKEEISEAVTSAYEEINNNSYEINIKIDNKEYTIDINNILYIESRRNNIIIKTTDNKEFKCRDNISRKEKELEEHGFVRTHYGYLVNLKYVSKIEGFFAILKDNIKVPVSRSNKQFVQQKFITYVR